MKKKEKQLAQLLRSRGHSLSEIVKQICVSKSSVSLWVRNIELTNKQKQQLSKKGLSMEAIEKRRTTRLKNENYRRQLIREKAQKEIKGVSRKELFLTGITFYWAEGAKTMRSGVQFSNSDARAVGYVMKFFRECCGVSEEKFRGRVFIHPHLDAKKSEKYWSKVSGIPLRQFYKTAIQQSKASKGKKDSIPLGTFNIQICNTELFLKIQGWIEGLFERVVTNGQIT
ncbi:hypothetical protein FJ208_01520 [Candidatus Gribaldobacteria bacterium]|nr:hypothetical protein [Candidatus Gribaldobacteria bacterium]